jgi:hypothetical protein
MKRAVACSALLLMLAIAEPAAGSPARASEAIDSVISFPSFPATAPYTATYLGTFSASGAVNDAGTITAQTLLSAVPSPSAAVLHTVRTLTSLDGTLVLRCEQHATSLSDLGAVPSSGTCAVLNATGVYSGFAGSGKVTGVTDLLSTPVTLSDELVL